jgi:hypothetical protein
MTDTAGDFYDLDPSVVPAGWVRTLDEDVIKLGVCTAVEDDADGPLCTETEGPGVPGVAQIRYGPVGTVPDQKEGFEALVVQTMHTSPSFDLDLYLGHFSGKGTNPVTVATVRGHDARSYDGNGRNTPTLTWQERPGLVVSVGGSNVKPQVVAAAAERIHLVDVERLPVPTVVARIDGVSWRGGDNNHPYLLAVRHDGQECIGWSFIDGCSQRPEDRGHVEFAGSSYWTLGAAPADVTSVDVMTTGGKVVASHGTYAVPGFTSRFFSVPSAADAPPYRISFHHDDGRVDSTGFGHPPLKPSALPTTIDGVGVLAGSARTDNGMPYRLHYIPARTAHPATGGEAVAVPPCYVLETVRTNAAWCGDLTTPMTLASDDIVLVVVPNGWRTDPWWTGPLFSTGVDAVWRNAVVVTGDQRVFAIAPDGTRTEVPSPVAAQPMPTFDEVTARLAGG